MDEIEAASRWSVCDWSCNSQYSCSISHGHHWGEITLWSTTFEKPPFVSNFYSREEEYIVSKTIPQNGSGPRPENSVTVLWIEGRIKMFFLRFYLKYANFTPWIWLTATRWFHIVAIYMSHSLGSENATVLRQEQTFLTYCCRCVHSIGPCNNCCLTLISAELRCLLLCDMVWKAPACSEVSIENQSNSSDMGCCVSRGKAVRGSSNDDLEAGQQNPTLRYGKSEFFSDRRSLIIFLQVSMFSLLKHNQGYFSYNGVIFISCFKLIKLTCKATRIWNENQEFWSGSRVIISEIPLKPQASRMSSVLLRYDRIHDEGDAVN